MRILVINAGSSSVKFSVFEMDSEQECFDSETERAASVEEALTQIPAALKKAGQHHFDAIGQRVGHGGEKFKDACVIDDAVVADIEACVPLAPMHNPPALAGMAMARKTWKVPQVAVFDTAFHQTIKPHATTYAVPESWRKAGVRRYGFHGTSHKYIMKRVAEELEKPAGDLRIISCHLGNGASVCAIERGQSVDTSMGMTPLEGLVMGTRSGDVDPGIFTYLKHALGLTVEQIESALYHDSGLAGLSGFGNDLRDIEKHATAGNKKAQLALEIYAYRIKKYIGSYTAAMGGVDVVSFTGGVGENSADMRKRICTGLEFFGLHFDEKRNAQVKLKAFEAPHLHTSHSQIKVLVTKTREQWMIAKDTHRLLGHITRSATTRKKTASY